MFHASCCVLHNDMINLNLLSPEKRKILATTLAYLTLERIALSLLALLAATAGILFFARTIVHSNLQTITAHREETAREYASINKEVGEANGTLRAIRELQRESFGWTSALAEIFALVPENVTLASLTVDRGGNTVILRGRAQTRDALLQFRERLEANPLLKSVSVPLSSLTLRENVDFEIRAALVPPKQP